MKMVIKTECMNIRQYNIIPDSPRLSLTVSAFYLANNMLVSAVSAGQPASVQG